jgi:predicted GIY-YIG superfamily endonuclease
MDQSVSRREKIEMRSLSPQKATTYYPRKMSKTTIYILRLKDGKYYIGKSDNPMVRYKDHLNGLGSAWTKLYTPVSVEKIIEMPVILMKTNIQKNIWLNMV